MSILGVAAAIAAIISGGFVIYFGARLIGIAKTNFSKGVSQKLGYFIHPLLPALISREREDQKIVLRFLISSAVLIAFIIAYEVLKQIKSAM